MFHWWHSRPRWHPQSVELPELHEPMRREVERRLEAGSTCGVPKTEGMCREILKLRQALWTFVHSCRCGTDEQYR